MNGRMVLDDIAKALGVSKTTVSRAISGTGRVSRETRERILAYVAQTGFVPNAAANNLATTRTRNIAYAMPLSESSITSDYFLECLFGVSQVATEHGYHVVVVDDSMEAMTHVVGSRKVDGLVVARFIYGEQAMQTLVDYQLPLVLTGSINVPGVKQVGYDSAEAYSALTEYAAKKWNAPIAILLTEDNFPANISRAEGFCQGMKRCGVEQPLICWGVNSKEILLETIVSLYRQDVRGIVCGDDYLCTDVLSILSGFANSGEPYLQQMSKALSLASFHSSRFLRTFHPEIPTVEVPPREMGRYAARAVIQEIEHGDAPDWVKVPYQLHLE